MNGQLPKDQVGAWQLMSVNINSQCPADIYPLTFEERCTAVLFGAVLVMAVYAPDCHEKIWMYTRHSSRMSPGSCGKNVELWPMIFTSP